MLHLFSANMELVQYGRQHYQPHSSETSTLLYQLFRRYRLDEFFMSDVMQEFVRETIELMLSELPPEKLLEHLKKLPPEIRLEGMSPEKRLEGLSKEELRQMQTALAQRLKPNGSAAQPE